jgi:hypothetical protein
VEAVFRIHKSELSLRPIWYKRADRVQAHVLVCFLAYVMWKTLEQWQSRAGLGNSRGTLLEELGRIYSADVVLPLAEYSDRALRIRCVLRPEPDQAMLIARLGLSLPHQRLQPPPIHPHINFKCSANCGRQRPKFIGFYLSNHRSWANCSIIKDSLLSASDTFKTFDPHNFSYSSKISRV